MITIDIKDIVYDMTLLEEFCKWNLDKDLKLYEIERITDTNAGYSIRHFIQNKENEHDYSMLHYTKTHNELDHSLLYSERRKDIIYCLRDYGDEVLADLFLKESDKVKFIDTSEDSCNLRLYITKSLTRLWIGYRNLSFTLNIKRPVEIDEFIILKLKEVVI